MIRPLAVALAALPLVSAAAPPRPPRSVSINPCIDAVLMHVADPAQIAGISHYSQDPRATSIPLTQARRFTATSGTAEEVVALAPDMVLTGPHVAPATIAALTRMKIRIVQYPVPDTVAESEEQVELMGSPNQRESVVANMEKRAPRFVD